jgi:CRISPR-associated endonuclease Csn1
MFYKPWDSFTQETKETIFNIVVSFKQNLRVINKSVNNYQIVKKNDDGKYVKESVAQTTGENWAIRKPIHKDSVSGLVKLRLRKIVSLSVALDNWEMITLKPLRKYIKKLLLQNYDKSQLLKLFKSSDNKWNDVDISKLEIYYWDKENAASRVKIDESFNSLRIGSITDTGIQNIMLNHLKKYNEDKHGKIIEHPESAFYQEGIDELNKNIIELNNGKLHQPIYKVRTYEPMGNKFNVGITGNKKDKFVEAAKGTNLFFAIYINDKGERSYETVPLNIVIERQKQALSPVPEKNEKGSNLSFYLSPNDLVYVPTQDEKGNPKFVNFENLDKEQIVRIYKFVSCTGNEGHFVPNSYATSIVKNEIGANNKSQNTIYGIQIKEVCWKLKTDRIGNIKLI